MKLVVEAIESAGYTGKVSISTDIAASEFYVTADGPNKGKYDLDFKNTESNDGSQVIDGDELISMYQEWCGKIPLASIEDPFDQDDFENCGKMMVKMGEDVQIVGDDIPVTNPRRVQKAIDNKLCNALLLKVNQIGTLTESIEAVNMAKDAGWGIMTSHRSGETEDNFIADLAIGLNAGQIKTGAPCRSERLAKYNQLLRIEEELGADAVYAGDTNRMPGPLYGESKQGM